MKISGRTQLIFEAIALLLLAHAIILHPDTTALVADQNISSGMTLVASKTTSSGSSISGSSISSSSSSSSDSRSSSSVGVDASQQLWSSVKHAFGRISEHTGSVN